MPATNFPGVYPSINDNSFETSLTSRFTCGLVGVAQQGPFGTIVSCPSTGAFIANFGTGLTGSYLAQAVASVAAVSDGANVVRVGTQYAQASTSGVGTLGAYTISTPDAARFQVNDYISIAQVGSVSTCNAVVNSVGTASLQLVSVGVQAVPLASSYNGATISRSSVMDSAYQAEGFLYAPAYGAVVTAVGTIVGTKSAYQFTFSGTSNAISAGQTLKITQANKQTTREATIASVDSVSKICYLQTTTNTQTGQQVVALQDNYTAGSVQVMTSAMAGGVALHLQADTAGTWANTIGSNTGLQVQVSPGSAQDTKKLIVYNDGVAVEVVDNLSFNSSSPNFIQTVLANDNYINVLGVLTTEPPSNTLAPWNTVNYTASNTATFANGFNGENVADADYIGTYNPTTDVRTGLKVYDDASTVNMAILAVPGVSSQAVIQELSRVSKDIKSAAIVDVPDMLNGQSAIDWQAAAGLYSNSSRIDSYNIAFFWNWCQATNPFTGATEWQPPTVQVLGAMASVFDQYGPWWATAGVVRGLLQNVGAVRYPRVSEDVKQAMYGNGNCLNPILLVKGGSILIWGDITAQRESSKLQALHTVNLVNYILQGMSNIAQRYVFDPNDDVLLNQLSGEFTTFLNSIQTGRGLEQYLLQCDDKNNTAATRNARNVIVNLSIIPTDVAERIYLNVAVNQSGAQLTAIS